MKPDLQVSILAKQIENYAWGYWYVILGMGLLGSLFVNTFGKYYNIPVAIITIFILIFGTVKMKKNENKIAYSLADLSIRLTKDAFQGDSVQ